MYFFVRRYFILDQLSLSYSNTVNRWIEKFLLYSMFDICMISRCLSNVPPDNKMDAVKDMLPAAIPFSLGWDSQVNRCFIPHTTSTTILVPLRKTLSIVVGFKQTRQVLSSVNKHDQKIKNLDCSVGLKLEGWTNTSSSLDSCDKSLDKNNRFGSHTSHPRFLCLLDCFPSMLAARKWQYQRLVKMRGQYSTLLL